MGGSRSDGEITLLIKANLKDWETRSYWIYNPKFVSSWAFIVSTLLSLCYLPKLLMVALHLEISKEHFISKVYITIISPQIHFIQTPLLLMSNYYSEIYTGEKKANVIF